MHLHVSLSHCLGYVCHCLPVSYTSLTYYCLFYCVQTCLDTDVMSSLSRTHVSCNVFPFIHYYCLFYCVKTCTYVHVFPFLLPLRFPSEYPFFRAPALYLLEYAFRGLFLRSMPSPMSLTLEYFISRALCTLTLVVVLACIFLYIFLIVRYMLLLLLDGTVRRRNAMPLLIPN